MSAMAKLAALHRENEALRAALEYRDDLLRRAVQHGRHETGCPADLKDYCEGAEIEEWADCTCWKAEVWDTTVMLMATCGTKTERSR